MSTKKWSSNTVVEQASVETEVVEPDVEPKIKAKKTPKERPLTIKESIESKPTMEKIKGDLQKDFFGIDDQIEEILEMVEPWSKVPECYIRPLIVNLWGMTGTGKTTLVRRIAKLLNIPLIEIDLGAFTSSSDDREFSKKFWEDYWELSGKPCIILIDEVHIARTIDSGGGEIDRDNIRGFWSLLSDGKIVIGDRVDQCRDLEWYFDDAMESYEEYQKEMADLRKQKKQDAETKKELRRIEKNHVRWAICTWTLRVVCKVLGINYKDTLRALEHDFVKEVENLRVLSKDVGFQPILDFSHSLIFISGNLDEVYPSVYDFDPDVDLDTLYLESLNINFAEVKYELAKRFRPEQIGRFGNNHIIYPALNRDAYIKIINHDMNRIKGFFKGFSKFGFDFDFDESVVDLIYREGVVPAQGARSVLSTSTSLLEASVISFVAKYTSDHESPTRKKSTKVKVSFNFKAKIMTFKTKDYEYNRKIKLKVDDLRNPKWTNASVARAVHEAGHVMSALIFLKSVPNRATAYSIGSNHTGVVETYTNRDIFVDDSAENLLAQIKIGLGSIVALEVVFGGREKVSGIHGDMNKITEYAVQLVNIYGYKRNKFGKTVLARDKTGNPYLERDRDITLTVEALIQDCYDEVSKEFEKHKALLLDLSKELVSKPRLSKEEIATLAHTHKVSHFVPTPYKSTFLSKYKEVFGEDLTADEFYREKKHGK